MIICISLLRYGPAWILCSFCGKGKRLVKGLITGPGVNICSDCIDLFQVLLEEK